MASAPRRSHPLDSPTVRARHGTREGAASRAGTPGLLVGRDTRESGEGIERDLALGATAAGASVVSAGIIPTPAVAHLTRSQGFGCGPCHFGVAQPVSTTMASRSSRAAARSSRKRSRPKWRPSWRHLVAGARRDAPAVPFVDEAAAYLAHARRALDGRRPHHARRIAVDCANGATYQVAPALLRALGFDVTAIGCEPDGRNINLDCGSTIPRAGAPGGRGALRPRRGLRRRRRPAILVDAPAHRGRRRGDAALRQADAGSGPPAR